MVKMALVSAVLAAVCVVIARSGAPNTALVLTIGAGVIACLILGLRDV